MNYYAPPESQIQRLSKIMVENVKLLPTILDPHRPTLGENDDIAWQTLDPRSNRKKTQSLKRSAQALPDKVKYSPSKEKALDILPLLEDLRLVTRRITDSDRSSCDRPCEPMRQLFKFAAKKEYIKTIEMLGGLYAVIDLIQADRRFHASNSSPFCRTLHVFGFSTLSNMVRDNENARAIIGKASGLPAIVVMLLEENKNDYFIINVISDFVINLTQETNHSFSIYSQTIECMMNIITEYAEDSNSYQLLSAVANLTANNRESAATFCSIEYSSDYLYAMVMMDNFFQNPITDRSKYGTAIAIHENNCKILANVADHIPDGESLLRCSDIYEILIRKLKSADEETIYQLLLSLYFLTADSTAEQIQLIHLGAVQYLPNLMVSDDCDIQLYATKLFTKLCAHIKFTQV